MLLVNLRQILPRCDAMSMLKETFIAMRDLPRLREISAILIRHGLGEFAQRLNLPKAMEKAGEWLHMPLPNAADYLDTPVRLRRALEDLGPTFIKLGQILATRADVFAADWITEFERLQSNAPALPEQAVQQLLQATLGCDPESVFSFFDPQAIGSASIAQVHYARLHDGTVVAIKLRRPNIVEKIEADLRILGYLAALIEQEFPEARRYQPCLIVKQFARALRRELNLAVEARNMERFAKNFANEPHIVVPQVFWQHTQQNLNVQTFIHGIPANRLDSVDLAGLDRKLLAKRAADAILKMILVDGYFHADPHPGNVFFLPDNRVVFVDFGMVGRLSPPRREELADLLAAFAQRSERAVFDVLINWTQDSEVDEARLNEDIAEFLFQYDQIQLKDLNLSQLIHDIMALMRDHAIVLPADLAMLFKALITLEGLVRQLDPSFQMVNHLTPFVRKVVAERYQPKELWRKGKAGLAELASVLGDVPHDMLQLAKEIRRGKFRIDLDLKRLDHFGQQLDKSANRLTMGIVTGCLIIGSSIVMTVDPGPMLFGLPLFGFLGFLVAFANSLWLMWSIWRSSKNF